MQTTQTEIEETKDMKTKIIKELKRLDTKVHRTSEARRALPAGSSRARVTTANARWATACEAHRAFHSRLGAWRVPRLKQYVSATAPLRGFQR